MMAMYGRHGESPMPIVAAYSPSHCFDAAIEAARLAVEYMTPVLLLSDGYLATGSEPWQLPDLDDLPVITARFATKPNAQDVDGNPVFLPYKRDDKLVRPWAVPGTEGLAHRVGGLEKEDGSGNVSYSPENHAHMIEIRERRIARIADDLPLLEITGDDDADVLVLGWGSTWGAISGAVRRVRSAGHKVAHAHLVHLNPFPRNLGDLLAGFDRVLIPEMNRGQLVRLIRAEYLVDARSITKVTGRPYTAGEIEQEILGEF
jgi:2-oxoglutarate ferredoxin oxidoreductase subunit alpha